MDNKTVLRNGLSQSYGINFSEDFHTLNSSQVEAILEAAKSWGYRKPKNANGSRARCFFAYLARTPKTELNYVVQGNYGQGWEDLTASTVRSEAVADLRAYRANDPAPTRMIQRREKI
jgi:hypothetical protein